MASALRASPEELVAAAASLDTHAVTLQGMLNHLVGLVGEAESSWKGSASSAYQETQERLNDLLRRSRDTLAAISENLASSGGEYARQEETSAQDLENIKGVDWGEDVFHHGEGGAQHVVREAGDKTTVECDPGKNCPEDLDKKLGQQQKELDDLKKSQEAAKHPNIWKDAGIGAAAGGGLAALSAGAAGFLEGGPAGAIAAMGEAVVPGAITGAIGAIVKDELN